MEDESVELVNREGYSAVNWDIEQTVVSSASGDDPKRGFCICPRCLEAFRQQQKLDKSEKLDAKAILDKHRDAWVMFRCRQNAELVGHMRQAMSKCVRPVIFSIYSGFQSQRTREWYGVDWELMAPHIDMGIAGYGGGRKLIEDTKAALGNVPFIGGINYYTGDKPIPNAQGWLKNAMAVVPQTRILRNNILSYFIDGGCHGVLLWRATSMDGGACYYTSEAAAIIAAYEDIFTKGKRCDETVACKWNQVGSLGGFRARESTAFGAFEFYR